MVMWIKKIKDTNMPLNHFKLKLYFLDFLQLKVFIQVKKVKINLKDIIRLYNIEDCISL